MFVNSVKNSSLYFSSKILWNIFDDYKTFFILKNENHRIIHFFFRVVLKKNNTDMKFEDCFKNNQTKMKNNWNGAWRQVASNLYIPKKMKKMR